MRKIDFQIFMTAKKHDLLKAEADSKKSIATRLRSILRDVDLESQPILSEDSPLTRKIRMLENRLDKSMIKSNEAQSIRKTYELIVTRLNEERVGFDNQLAAIERTLKAKDHDYHELLNISHDANHAKEVAVAQLQEFRAAYNEERKTKDKELSDRKAFVQARIDQTQKLERREKMRRSADVEENVVVVDDTARAVFDDDDSLGAAELRRLAEYEAAFKTIREALHRRHPRRRRRHHRCKTAVAALRPGRIPIAVPGLHRPRRPPRRCRRPTLRRVENRNGVTRHTVTAEFSAAVLRRGGAPGMMFINDPPEGPVVYTDVFYFGIIDFFTTVTSAATSAEQYRDNLIEYVTNLVYR